MESNTLKNRINFFILYELYDEEEKSYISATVKYIESLDIDMSEFNFSELPPEWVMCLEKEAREKNLIKKNSEKNSFIALMGNANA